MRKKQRMLEKLRRRIVSDLFLDDWRDVWFFPTSDKIEGWRGPRVDGWHGTQDIMFVALNPSTGRFPSAYDKNFYATLRRQRFARAHLSDTIKERAVGGEVKAIREDTRRMERYRRYLLKEI